MAFTLKDGARLSLVPLTRALSRRGRLRLTLRTARSLPLKGSGHCTSTPGVSPRRRQPATGPPGGYPDRTHTGWRRRASERVRSSHHRNDPSRSLGILPGLVEVEVAVPRLTPALR